MGFISWERKETEPLSSSIYIILKWYYIVQQAPARWDSVILGVAHVQAYLSMHETSQDIIANDGTSESGPGGCISTSNREVFATSSWQVKNLFPSIYPMQFQEKPNIPKLLTLNIGLFRKVHLWSMKSFRTQPLQPSDLQQGSVPNYKPKGSQSQQHTRVCIFGRDVLSFSRVLLKAQGIHGVHEYVYEIMLLTKTFVKNLSRPSLQLS